MPFVTDVHSHLVPSVDDGSNSAEKSVEMLRHMNNWGINRVILTPHYTEETFENTPATIDPAYEVLVAAVHDAGLDGLTLLPPAGEYRVDNYFVSQVEAGTLRPLHGDYLLVENGFAQEPWDLDKILFDLTVKGYKPVMAHPERYRYYHENPKRYQRLHDDGVFFQCNLLSLAGYYGKEVKAVAEKLIEQNLVDFLGTDIHGMRHINCLEQYMKTSHFKKVSDKLRDRLLNDKI